MEKPHEINAQIPSEGLPRSGCDPLNTIGDDDVVTWSITPRIFFAERATDNKTRGCFRPRVSQCSVRGRLAPNSTRAKNEIVVHVKEVGHAQFPSDQQAGVKIQSAVRNGMDRNCFCPTTDRFELASEAFGE